jgi:hypothetical protein
MVLRRSVELAAETSVGGASAVSVCGVREVVRELVFVRDVGIVRRYVVGI